MAKLLGDLANRSGARDELFRLSKYEGLGTYLVSLGVDPAVISAKWEFDRADAVLLISGIGAGALNAAASAYVVGVLVAALLALLSPEIAALFAFVGASAVDWPMLTRKFREATQVRDAVMKVLKHPLAAASNALSSERSEIERLMLAQQYYDAGKRIGDLAIQIALAGMAFKSLVGIAQALAPKMTWLAKNIALRYQLVALNVAIRTGAMSGAVDGWEFVRIANKRLLLRRTELGAVEASPANLNEWATEQAQSPNNQGALERLAAPPTGNPSLTSPLQSGLNRADSIGSRGTAAQTNGVSDHSAIDIHSRGTADSVSTTDRHIGSSQRPMLNTSGAGQTTAAMSPIEGALETKLSETEYRAALGQVFPSQYVNRVARTVDAIGQRAALRVAQNPEFVAALQSGDRMTAGNIFHSAAAEEIGVLPSDALPPGWSITAEEVIRSGQGGSRTDVLLRGPQSEVVEFDWKTTGGSALIKKSRDQMIKHAGQITVKLGRSLTVQESRSWVDYVRPVLPGTF
ncbi:MAG TPA: hypothetical protein VKC11_12075 [Steroidobacteraceae bacterium]|nr:hypothetical protein [Steroidobacteraceae bacterium]